MGSSLAWSTLLNCSAARRDRGNFNNQYHLIKDDVRLVAVNFLNDQYTVYGTAPIVRVVITETLPNCGSSQKQSKFNYEQSIGRTALYEHTVGFEYGVTTGFTSEINFLGLGGEVSFEASFTFSGSSSISESIEHTRTRGYTFTLTAAPNSTNTGEATVQEASGSVPYDLVFDFGGVEKRIRGTWVGVTVSNVIFHTQEVTHNPSACLS